ncbi:unnamed protein product [Sphagnum balticum]
MVNASGECDTDIGTRHAHSDVIGHLQSTRAHTAAHRADNAHCARRHSPAAAAIGPPTTYTAHNSTAAASSTDTARIATTQLRSHTARTPGRIRPRDSCAGASGVAGAMGQLRLGGRGKSTRF